MHAYLLLDRSGSMADRWIEALGAVNSFVTKLASDEATRTAHATVATFDSAEGIAFDVVRDAVPVRAWSNLSDRDATPRGMTPLFDAIGRIVALAEIARPDKAVIIVMTDGHENASREITKAGARAALDRVRERGWQVVFLGADFDAMDQAASVGTAAGQTLNTTSGNYAEATAIMASATARYVQAAAPMAFTEAERARAKGEKKGWFRRA